MKDGYLGKCKECTKKDSNKHRADNLESVQEYDRKRASLPHRTELRKQVTKTWIEDGRHKEAQQRYKDKYPERYKARNIFQAAKRDGKILVPNSCSSCGKKGVKLEAHHKDYSKPLEVQWLCIECHGDTRRIYPKQETIQEAEVITKIKEKVYKQPIFTQMELFEQPATYSTA